MTEPLCITNNPPDYATLVSEALDADEQHGNVRGIKYAILAVAQAIRDVPEALRDMHVLTEVERDIAAADAFDALVGAISRGVRETRRAA